MFRNLIIASALTISLSTFGQIFTSNDSTISLSGFIDMYYLYDFNKPFEPNRSDYEFVYDRHNEINLNIGFIKASLDREKVRANLALQTGTYAQANYGAEPPIYRNILEANVGIRLADKVWFTTGIMPSYIGIETAVNQDCYNLTRSIMANNSPFFLTGAALTYEGDKLNAGLYALNGWQTILETNPYKSIGYQVSYALADNITANISGYIGNETNSANFTDSLRNFFDFYIMADSIYKGLSFSTAYDIMMMDGFEMMNAFSFIPYYKFQKFGIGARFEMYLDPDEINVSSGTPNGFQVLGGSGNIDWFVAKNTMLRLEGRYLDSEDFIFKGDRLVTNGVAGTRYWNSTFFSAISLSVKF